MLLTYGSPANSGLDFLLYGLTTSGGMIALITAMIGGVLAAVLGLLMGVSGELAVWIGLGGGVIALVAMLIPTLGLVSRGQARLGVLFPAPKDEPGAEPSSSSGA